MSLDPSSAAQYALIATALVVLGALITPNATGLGTVERGTVLVGIVTVLLAIAWRGRRRNGGE